MRQGRGGEAEPEVVKALATAHTCPKLQRCLITHKMAWIDVSLCQHDRAVRGAAIEAA